MTIKQSNSFPAAAAAATLSCVAIASPALAQDQSGKAPSPPAQNTPASSGAGSSQQTARAQVQSQAGPQIEQQRQQAEQDAKKTLDSDAIVAIAETQNAIKAIDQGKADEAVAALERATGKIQILLARNPATALMPVEFEVSIIDVAPLDLQAIRQFTKAAEQAVEGRDYPTARLVLAHLTSEIRVRTTNLPLATYPIATQEAARLLDQNKTQEAKGVLTAALSTLLILDHARPLPVVIADAAVERAQAMRDKDKEGAKQLLAVAKSELERAKELGYAGADPEYGALTQAVAEVEAQLNGGQDSTSAFARLTEKIKSFFKRQSDTERNAQLAGSNMGDGR